MRWSQTWPKCFHLEKKKKREKKVKVMTVTGWTLPWLAATSRCCLDTQLFWTGKTSYLMQYLVRNTNMESVSSLKRKCKKEKKYYHVYIYLTNVKAFFPFYVWILWKWNSPLLGLQSTYCSFPIAWMEAWLNCVTFPVYVNRVCARACAHWRVLCWLLSTKCMKGIFIWELKWLEI